MKSRDVEHFSERAGRERRAAREAADPRTAAMHEELAARYQAVAEAFAALDRARTGQA